MDMGIAGRTAVVIGGGAIGRHTTRLLIAEGAQVVVVDRDKDDLKDVAAWLPEGVPSPLLVPCDLSSQEAARDLAATVAELAGEVDVLVHAAATTGAAGAFDEIADEDWVAALTHDLLAAVRVTRAFLPALRQGDWGRVVLVTHEDAGLPSAAAGAGLLALARALARSYADEGLLVSSVSPSEHADDPEEVAAAIASLCSGGSAG